jgi:ribosomal-protein-serine acetyltransferase
MFSLKVDAESSIHLLEARHAEELFALTDRNRLYLRQWLPWLDQVTEVDHTTSFIEGTLRQFSEGNGFQGGLWYRGKFVGVAGLHGIARHHRTTSIGYWLGEEYQGRGLMTRAVARMLDHLFGELGLNHVEIKAATGNLKSRAIPERLGFVLEGVLRNREWLYDHFVDHAVYGMLASEWAGSPRFIK